MKQSIKKIAYCLPLMVVLLLTMLLTAPSASAAQLKAPVLKAPVNTVSGVKVSWNKVTNAQKYRVYVKTGSASWKKLADTAATSYLHKAAKSGVTYAYTVRCISKDGKTVTSDCNKSGKRITYVSAPAVTSFSNTRSGPKLYWKACKGASKYRVDIKTSSGWKKLAVTTNTYYTHALAKNNTTYTYRVQSLNASSKAVSAVGAAKANKYRYAEYTNKAFAQAVYTAIGKPYTEPASPNTLLNRQSAAAILVKALGYPARSLVTLKDTIDLNLMTIASYGYLLPDRYDKIYPVKQITITEYEAIMNDVNRYALYKGKTLLCFGDSIMYGQGNSGFGYGRLIAEKLGMTYKGYAANGATFSTSYNGRKHIVDQVNAAHAANVKADVILLNGGTNDMGLVAKNYGAERFDSTRPADSNFAKGFVSTMKLLGQFWSGTPVIYIRDHNMAYCADSLERSMGSYGISIAKYYKAQTIDFYTSSSLNAENLAVRSRYTMHKEGFVNGDSIHPNGLCYATYHLPLIAKNMVFTPKLNAPVNTNAGVQLSWSSVGDAPRYRIFTKSASGWVKLADTNVRSYVHTGAVSGRQYTYTVRCMTADGRQFTGNYDAVGKTVTYVKAPVPVLTNETDGVRLSWNAADGAENYRVMIAEDGTWKTVADTAGTSCTYPNAVSGEAYTFTVRCINASGAAYVSDIGEPQTITYIAAPQITSVTDETNGAKITWNAVNGAKKYRVLLNDEGTWKTLNDTDALSFTHDAEHETYYTYAVCCLDERDNVVSGYYPDGYTHLYRIPAILDTPVISGFENREAGLFIKWNAITGAQKYRVLKKSGGRWTTLAQTNGTTCLDTNVSTGESLTYTVCCITADGKAYASAYDSAGSTYVYFGAPDIKITDTSVGLLITFDGCAYASGHRLYIKNGGTWTPLADTTETTYLYTGASEGTEYAFTACYLDESGSPLGPYHDAGTSHTFVKDTDNVIYTMEEFANDIAAATGKPAVTVPAGAVLNRRSASETLCKALGYSTHKKGVTLLDSDSLAMKTTVFLGYFYPNESGRIYPEAQITDVEYKALMTEVGRYAKLNGKTALAFGDSIMYGYGNNGFGSCCIICEKYGVRFINYSYCGATMSTCNNGRVHIPDRIKAAHAAGYKADIIFLNGGTNDLTLIRKGGTPDTFDPKDPKSSTFSQGLDYAFMLIRYFWGDTPVMYTRNHNMVVSSESLEKQLGEYGLKIANKYYAHTVDIYTDTDLDTEDPVMRDRYTMYRSDLGRCDGIHPNALGYTTYYLPLETKMILSILLS